jgi:two-component system chemotaxis response regulator CheY
MTGVQLAQQVRDENKENAPGFVLITSEAERAEAGTLSKCGRAVLLQKPFTPQQLGDALKLVSDMNQSATRVARSSARPSKLRILIVDDSTSARAHIRHALTSAGLARFVEATDGAQAVAAVAKETFDLIVTDYNMPLMDGCGLVGYLRQNPATASIPIIMATTEKDPTKLDEVRRLGVTVCDKSLPSQVVQQIIEQLV